MVSMSQAENGDTYLSSCQGFLMNGIWKRYQVGAVPCSNVDASGDAREWSVTHELFPVCVTTRCFGHGPADAKRPPGSMGRTWGTLQEQETCRQYRNHPSHGKELWEACMLLAAHVKRQKGQAWWSGERVLTGETPKGLAT